VENKYCPEKDQYQFTPDDMVDQMNNIKKFKNRYQDVEQRIQQTYSVGNKFQSYLEKKCILHYHLKGEQETFEKEYPHLKKKALKLLGPVLYYDLTTFTGVAVGD